MRLKFTQKDYNYMIAEVLTRLIQSGFLTESAKKISGPAVTKAKGDLKAHIAQLIKDNDPTIHQIANNIGINFNFDKNDRQNIKNSLLDDNGHIIDAVMDEILDSARILSKYTGKSGNFDSAGDGNTSQMELDYPERYDELMRMKDFIDQMGLTYLYDKSFIEKPAKRKYLNGKFGISIDDEGNVDTSKFDLNYMTQQDIDDYIKGGMKKDADGIKQLPSWARGKSQDEINSIVEARKIAGILNTYLSSKYGIKLSMPSSFFSAGNAKVASDTLIINFASAQRCPAWNECIVKHACYARGTEHFRQNVRDANTQRGLLWATGEKDDEMLRLLFNLVQAYAFNYYAAAKELGMSMDELREMPLSEIQDKDIIEALQNNRNVINLRLNEDGDFIAQWLVEAWNEFAGQLRRFGVVTTCYTCRKLNFKNIENIIINASNTGVKGPGVKRYFFAVTEDMYDAFDETYTGPNNALIFERGEDGKTKITPNIQPLYGEDGKPNGNYYYKCPCGRKDGIGTSSEGKVDCYQCRTCYEPTVIGDGRPYYVFVKIHGTSKGDFKGRTTPFGVSKNYWKNMEKIAIKNGETINESFIDTIGNIATGMANPNIAHLGAMADGVRAIRRSIQNGKRKAIGQITRNTINSVNEHLKNL